jgi:hypothetical protein
MKYWLVIMLFVTATLVNGQTTFYFDVSDTVEVRSYCFCKEKHKFSEPNVFFDWFKIKLKKDEEMIIEIGQEYPNNRLFITLSESNKDTQYITITKDGDWIKTDTLYNIDEH